MGGGGGRSGYGSVRAKVMKLSYSFGAMSRQVAKSVASSLEGRRFARLDFAERGHGTADALGQFLLGQVQLTAASPEPFAEGDIIVHHTPLSACWYGIINPRADCVTFCVAE